MDTPQLACVGFELQTENCISVTPDAICGSDDSQWIRVIADALHPDTWLASEAAEEDLLRRYKDEIAVMVPCTTFGNPIDLDRYDRFHEQYDVDVVVAAAAALGSLDYANRQFGSGSRWPVVYSMHATKPFACGEGGVIYCTDQKWMEELRSMASFGFEKPRIATLPGLNAKISEVASLTAYLQLQQFDEDSRQNVVESRRDQLRILR